VGIQTQIESSRRETAAYFQPVSHTHTNLLVHIVFSTQGHLPLITSEIKNELFAYLGGLVKELKGKTDHYQRNERPCSPAGLIAAECKRFGDDALCKSEFVAMGQGAIREEVRVAKRFWSV